jgi:hypothetical protein
VNDIAQAFVLVSVAALLLFPRRWAPVPLIAGTCYMTLGQGLELGPFTFTVIRILVAAGAVRAVIRREGLATGMNRLDWLMVAWALWVCASSGFQQRPSSALVYRLGLAYNACGVYFLLRIFCTSVEDVMRLCQTTALVLTLVAAAMLYEHATLYNIFSIFGGVPETPSIRGSRVRAFGPFAHPILAGTVGAVSLPLMVGIWRYRRLTALLGTLACLAIVVTSASSGPVMSATVGVGALLLWPYRHQMWACRWIAAFGFIALTLFMKAPVYYLLSHIDIVGGSTGWYRSRLIESAFEHLNEWWLAGTDYTRHWMAEGMLWDSTQVDITNHYLSMGVVGGLPLVLFFVAALAVAFSFVGRAMRGDADVSRQRFLIWALGCALFAHTVTFVSVSYFDQSFVFLYLTLAAIGSARFQTGIVTAHEKGRSPVNLAVNRPGRPLQPVTSHSACDTQAQATRRYGLAVTRRG